MNILTVALYLSLFLCSLVAGFLFAFAVVVMPGIKKLNDAVFLAAFQKMDRIIQNNNPLFVLVWLGSIVTMVTLAVTGIKVLSGPDLAILILAILFYLLGVQLVTMTINVPLNNKLQALDLQSMAEQALTQARRNFEPRWNKWNRFRTIMAIFALLLLMMLIYRV